MDNLKQTVANVVDKVEEVVGGKQEEPKVEEPVVTEPEAASVVEEAPVVEENDRSAYNCVACKGEGIVNNVICSVCGGTGKV